MVAAVGERGMAGGRPSLLQDVMRGRRTEIEELNGFVVAEGKRLGVPTPFNEAVVREVKRHGVGTLRARTRRISTRSRRCCRRPRRSPPDGTNWTVQDCYGSLPILSILCILSLVVPHCSDTRAHRS